MSGLKRLLFLLLIVALLFAAFVAATPLRFIAEHAAPQTLSWFSSLRGTVVEGGVTVKTESVPLARAPAIAAVVPSMDFAWRWCPGSGVIAWCIHGASAEPEADFSGVIAWSPWAVTLSEFSLKGVVAGLPLRTVLNQRLSEIVGEKLASAQLQMARAGARLAAGHTFPHDVKGRLSLRELVVAEMDLGNVNMTVASDDKGAIGVRLQGKGGDIKEVTGSGSLTPSGYRYKLNVQSANQSLLGALELYGKRSSKGFVLDGSGEW